MRGRAFTLVELLVSIGIIAILMGLLVPTLARTRVSAMEIRALAQLRDLGITMELYLQDSRGVYPWHPVGVPYRYAPPGTPAGTLYSSDEPWAIKYLWATTMHSVAPWSEHYLNWLGVRPPDTGEVPWANSDGSSNYPTYHYSNSFVGDPACWLNSGTPRPSPVRALSVRFPASKALMFDSGRPYLPIAYQDRPTRAVLAADGSAAMRDDQDAARPFPNRLRPGLGVSIYHDTPGGVLGRDF